MRGARLARTLSQTFKPLRKRVRCLARNGTVLVAIENVMKTKQFGRKDDRIVASDWKASQSLKSWSPRGDKKKEYP